MRNRKCIRLNKWNYSNNGFYFVTICTHNKFQYFGKIENKTMILNNIGDIVKTELLKTIKINNEIKIHEYCIMPNHLHIIIQINNINNNGNIGNVGGVINVDGVVNVGGVDNVVGIVNVGNVDGVVNVGNRRACSLQQNIHSTQQNIHPKPQNIHPTQQNISNTNRNNELLFVIIGSFKSACTKQINKIHPYFFKWQKSFYDRIIRNETAYLKIKHYIKNNPKMWNRDRNNYGIK